MGDDQVAARCHGIAKPGEDRLGLAQICQDRQGGGAVVGQQRVGMHVHHGVVVDVYHPRVWRDLSGDLVHVALGGQAGADVQELPDAGLGEVADGALQERAVLPGALAGLWRRFEDGLGGGAVNGVVVLAAQQRVVDLRWVGGGGVDAGGWAGLLVAGHTGSWGVGVAGCSQSGSGTWCWWGGRATAGAGKRRCPLIRRNGSRSWSAHVWTADSLTWNRPATSAAVSSWSVGSPSVATLPVVRGRCAGGVVSEVTWTPAALASLDTVLGVQPSCWAIWSA